MPAHNEELLIAETLSGVPKFVGKIFVVNDASTDKTGQIIKRLAKNNKRIVLISHKENQGLGATLSTGYIAALKAKIDVIAVMAGDNQMDPTELTRVVNPIIDGKTDYVKGNRLLEPDVAAVMPKYRLVGNAVATILTKFATGYWGVIDPQCGYTAISYEALSKIDIKSLKRGYGYNADILTRLNILNFSVTDVPVTPVYGKEKSGIKFTRYVVDVCWLLLKLFLKRMKDKYLVRDFHPLIFFYLMSFVNVFLVSLPLVVRFIYLYAKYGYAPQTTLIILSFTATIGFFSFFFATWMDMEDNKKLFQRLH